jgi:BirA family transcriptional regulator, biotin operon repressor / biotin---[acetyl-CoA-carboxylase] ligase
MTPTIRTIPETESTNTDMLVLAANGEQEGLWLRAERQTAGRGRMGRNWSSPVGNLYTSTIIRLQPADPPGATLGFVAAVALDEVLSAYAPDADFQIKWPNDVLAHVPHSTSPTAHGDEGLRLLSLSKGESPSRTTHPSFETRLRQRPVGSQPLLRMSDGGLAQRTLVSGAKISGILLERQDQAIILGMGVNLASHPEGLGRPATSVAALTGTAPDPHSFLEPLADAFARWLSRWRGEGIGAVLTQWRARAHPLGTALSVNLPDNQTLEGLYDGLDSDGALKLRLADGSVRAIHAGDVFLI